MTETPGAVERFDTGELPQLALARIMEEMGVADRDDVSGFVCGNAVGLRQGPVPKAIVYRWRCPWCDPETGRIGDDVCPHCHGETLTNDVGDWPEAELVRAPRPPGVMKRPCVDCAYRPGSPETDVGHPGAPCGPPGAETPFFCHTGLVRVGDGYSPPALVNGLPLGALVCAAWWALATGEPVLPLAEYRDRAGNDRSEDAPDAVR